MPSELKWIKNSTGAAPRYKRDCRAVVPEGYYLIKQSGGDGSHMMCYVLRFNTEVIGRYMSIREAKNAAVFAHAKRAKVSVDAE